MVLLVPGERGDQAQHKDHRQSQQVDRALCDEVVPTLQQSIDRVDWRKQSRQREEPTAISIEVLFEVDVVFHLIGKEDDREEEADGRAQKHEEEYEESPFGLKAPAEENPPIEDHPEEDIEGPQQMHP